MFVCNLLLKCSILLLVFYSGVVSAQDIATDCYGPGSIALSVILSIILTVLVIILGYYLWKRYKKSRKEHLILETDVEKGKSEYAFDNPGFKDAAVTPATNSVEKHNPLEANKLKWNQWSPLSALSAVKTPKRKTLDDSTIDGNQVKVVALRSHDFTGLGFNICGNMKEGIFIKDILHHGPASESGKLNSGDRINSVTISFEHMVYEDALAILSYASPYEVMIEAKSDRPHYQINGQSGQPSHPVYRSSSYTDLYEDEKTARKKLFNGDDYTSSLSSTYSSLQKSKSNMTTLERQESKSPKVKKPKGHLMSEQLKTQLEKKVSPDHQQIMKNKINKPAKVEAEVQKTENKYQKFGIKVFPTEQKNLKNSELSSSQNDNNINIEKNSDELGYDEVDLRQNDSTNENKKTPEKSKDFERTNVMNGSGIKRDKNGIPQEIPNYMLNAAVAARTNRRASADNKINRENDDSENKSQKKLKGKAPAPPEEKFKEHETFTKANLDEIKPLADEIEEEISKRHKQLSENSSTEIDTTQVELRQKTDYNSDSDVENETNYSSNTIELNSSDITIHCAEENEEMRKNRKTASTGDLTKIERTRNTGIGTLERAQSLDITDPINPTVTKKRQRSGDDFDLNTDFGKTNTNKEPPKLSSILDGLNTFQRNRLKKSTEWGNLEDAILKLNQESENNTSNNSLDDDLYENKSKELDALVNKINQIKRESLEIDVSELEIAEKVPVIKERKVKNQIWPNFPSQDFSSKTQNLEGQDFKTIEKITNNLSEIEKVQNDLEIFQNNSLDKVQKSYEQIPKEPRLEIRTIAKDTNKNDEEISRIRESVQDYEIQPKEISQEKHETEKNEDVNKSVKPKIPVKSNHLLEKIEIVQQNRNEPPSEEKEETKEMNRVVLRTDERKIRNEIPYSDHLVDSINNFIFTERIASSEDNDDICRYVTKTDDTNISDDIKVSRHSLENFEKFKNVVKSNDSFNKYSQFNNNNISNVTINNENGEPSPNNLELSLEDSSLGNDSSFDKLNDMSELYATALDNSFIHTRNDSSDTSLVTITTPDLIKNTTITETISPLSSNDVTIQGPTSLTLEIPSEIVEISKFSVLSPNGSDKEFSSLGTISPNDNKKSLGKNNSPQTYITEIQVITPTNSVTNISEIEIIPNVNNINNEDTIKTITNNSHQNGGNRNLDNEFEDYVKNFESNSFDSNSPTKFETILENSVLKNDVKTIILNEKIDAEKELHKIQEIAEEQLKKLPEMRFTTSSYEGSRIPEKRQSQIEMLRSNFEKSPPKSGKSETITKSRIPIATTTKTPPTSPERRDSRNLDMENDKAILELMSSNVHSTPIIPKYQNKSNSKNVTVTSIRNNSKIPSGLPILSSSSRPPVPPRKHDNNDHVVQLSTNGGMESSFKQWVFNPSDSAITNIVVSENKQDYKQ